MLLFLTFMVIEKLVTVTVYVLFHFLYLSRREFLAMCQTYAHMYTPFGWLTVKKLTWKNERNFHGRVWNKRSGRLIEKIWYIQLPLTPLNDGTEEDYQTLICPRHRDSFGIRWRTCKVSCCVPPGLSTHTDKVRAGDRGITLEYSRLIFGKLQQLIPIGSRKFCSQIIFVSNCCVIILFVDTCIN